MKRIFAGVCTALLITGCATAPNTVRLTDGTGASEKVVQEMSIDPVMLSGLPWTKNLQDGNFVVVMGTFPQTAVIYAEWDPLRIRYQALAVGANGEEYVAYAMFAGFIRCVPRYFVFVEGLKEPRADVKVITLSTLLDHAYALSGKEIEGFDGKKFRTDATYRREVVGRSGTSLRAVPLVPDMRDAIVGSGEWQVYKTPSGPIVTTLNEKQVKFLAGMNPQYSYWEKFIGTTRGSLSADYISTTVSLMFDFIQASQAKSQGFDHASGMTRMKQGYNLAIMQRLQIAGQVSCLAGIAQERSKP